MKFCSKCTIPETAETLVFDETGACSVCNQIDYKNKINCCFYEKKNERV